MNTNLRLVVNNENSIEKEVSSEKEALRQRKLNILHQTGHVKASNLYRHVKTDDILRPFLDEDFHYDLDDMKIRGGRKHSSDFKAHLVVLKHPKLENLVSSYGIDPLEFAPRIYVWNSYDRSKSVQFDIGFFRGFCWNSMVFGNKIAETIRIVHKRLDTEEGIKEFYADINTAIAEMVQAFENDVVSTIKTLMETEMSEEAQIKFAHEALKMRLDKTDDDSYVEGDVTSLLKNYEKDGEIIQADVGNSCWQVLNRIQRNLGLNFEEEEFLSQVKYSFKSNKLDEEGEQIVKERSLRHISEPVRVIDLNKRLMDLMVDYLPEEVQKIEFTEKVAA